MEIAFSVFSALSTAAATAAPAAGTAAAAAGTTAAAAGSAASFAGMASTAFNVLQGVFTAGSVLSSLSGGVIADKEAGLQASAAELQAREEALRIRTDEVQKIGAARVAFAGSGVSLSSGDAIESDLASQSQFESGLALNSGAIKAGQIRLSGSGKKTAATGDALGSIASYALSLAKRG